jgi:outer membrane receptor protein involved in Fe transport
VFAQVRVSAATSLLAEYRRTEREAGDLPLRFDPAAFAAAFRQSLRSDLVRVGARHDLTPSSTLLASLSYEHALSILTFDPESALETRQNTYNAELQHLFRSRRLRLVSGAGFLGADGTDRVVGAHAEPTPLETRLANAYTYAHLSLPASLVLTLGAAVESLSSDLDDSTQVEPKLGAVWQPRPGTTLRAAGFRTLGRLFAGDQTIEPTQVAGFSQLYDDVPLGTDTWRYGIGVDQRITARAFAGAEVARRDMTLPFLELDQETLAARIGRVEWREDVGRAYVYWAPLRWLALSAQYFYERLHRHPDMPGDAQIVGGRTHRVPLGIAVFAPFGLSGTLTGTYVDQRGDFGNAVDGIVAGRDRFWVVDASVSYRLPKRRGFLTLEVRNLLDDRFRFNETDTPQPTIAPERVVLFKLTLAF